MTELPHYYRNKLISMTCYFITYYFSYFKCQCNIAQQFFWVSPLFLPCVTKLYLVKCKYCVHVVLMKYDSDKFNLYYIGL